MLLTVSLHLHTELAEERRTNANFKVNGRSREVLPERCNFHRAYGVELTVLVYLFLSINTSKKFLRRFLTGFTRVWNLRPSKWVWPLPPCVPNGCRKWPMQNYLSNEIRKHKKPMETQWNTDSPGRENLNLSVNSITKNHEPWSNHRIRKGVSHKADR